MQLVEQLLMVVMGTFITSLLVMELLQSIVLLRQLIVLIIWLLLVVGVDLLLLEQEVAVAVDFYLEILVYHKLHIPSLLVRVDHPLHREPEALPRHFR
jgi:hypothetical protein